MGLVYLPTFGWFLIIHVDKCSVLYMDSMGYAPCMEYWLSFAFNLTCWEWIETFWKYFVFFLPFGTWYLGCYDHLGNMFGSCIKHRGQAKTKKHGFSHLPTEWYCPLLFVMVGVPRGVASHGISRKKFCEEESCNKCRHRIYKIGRFPYIYI